MTTTTTTKRRRKENRVGYANGRLFITMGVELQWHRTRTDPHAWLDRAGGGGRAWNECKGCRSIHSTVDGWMKKKNRGKIKWNKTQARATTTPICLSCLYIGTYTQRSCIGFLCFAVATETRIYKKTGVEWINTCIMHGHTKLRTEPNIFESSCISTVRYAIKLLVFNLYVMHNRAD